MKKRILSIILALIICSCLLPAAAQAAEDLSDATSGITLKDSDDDDYYEVGTADELIAFANLVNGGKDAINAELTADIDMTDKAWPFMFYAGIIDGRGHTISNLKMTEVDLDGSYAAGFMYAMGATVKNIYFEDCSAVIPSTVSADDDCYVGIIAGASEGITLVNCTAIDCTVGQYGIVGQMSYAGGLVGGGNAPASLDGCSFQGGSVTAEFEEYGPNYVGGLVAGMWDFGDGSGISITNSFCSGDLTGDNTGYCAVGGLIGLDQQEEGTSPHTYTDCYFSGDITSTVYSAGLIPDCCATGTVTNCAVLSEKISSPYGDPFVFGQAANITYSGLTIGSYTEYVAQAPSDKEDWVSGQTGTQIDKTKAEAHQIAGFKSNLYGKLADGSKDVAVTLSQNGTVKYTATTDGNGAYNFGKQVLPGKYTLNIAASAGYLAYETEITIDYAANEELDITRTAISYTATVVNGTGGGDYIEGVTVTIKANAPATGKKFAGWTSEDGVTFADSKSSETTFIMPAKAVTVTATYADLLPGKVIVNGVDLVNGDDDHTIDCGRGTAVYDPQTLTLTLTNAQITTPSAPALASCGIYASDLTGDFTIVLIGDNSITLTDKAYDNTGIYRWGSHQMTIQGSGSLSIEIFDDATPQGIGGNNGDIVIKDVTLTFALASGSNTNGNMLHTNKTITIDHANISTADSGYLQCIVTPAADGIIIKNGSNVNVSAIENAIYSDGDITIEDSTVSAAATDYAAICGWGDISITDSTVTAESEWDNGIYCYGEVAVSGGTVNIISRENDAFCANGGITVTDNAKVTTTGAGAGIYTNEIVSVESGEVHATGGNWAILARRISNNAQDSKPADSAVALIYDQKLLEASGAAIKTEDWVYTEVWDDWDYDYYDKWMSRSYFTDKDGNKLTSASIVPGYTITFNTDGGSTIDPITQAAGTTVSAPEAPTKQGHIFKGWDKDFPSVMPANDITLTAMWELKPDQAFEAGFDAAQDKIYGDAPYTRAAAVTSANPGAVTYTSSDESVATVDAQGKVTILKAGTTTITATAAETAANAETSAGYVLTVARKAVTVTALDKRIYRNRPAPDLSAPVEGTDYTIEGVVAGDTVVVFLSCNVDTSVVGEYAIVPEIEAPAGKYTFDKVNGTLTVRAVASGSASTTPIITKTTGGSVTCDNAKPAMGTQVTFTAKPDAGKVVDTVTVTYAGREVSVREGAGGSYTFFQPAGAATITVTFKDAALVHDCPAAGFTDVDTSKWYHAAIDYVLEHDIMAGYNKTTFGPDDTLSRAMVVQVLYNYEKTPDAPANVGFDDVPDGQWYTHAVRWAAGKGVVAGYGDGRFGPDDSVTIEQMAVILWNYSGTPAASAADLSVVGSHSDWAVNALNWAVANDIFDGMPMENAADDATRAQTAQMLMNYLSR